MGFRKGEERAREWLPGLPEPEQGLLPATHEADIAVFAAVLTWRAGGPDSGKGAVSTGEDGESELEGCARTDRAAGVKTEEICELVDIEHISDYAVVQQTWVFRLLACYHASNADFAQPSHTGTDERHG